MFVCTYCSSYLFHENENLDSSRAGLHLFGLPLNYKYIWKADNMTEKTFGQQKNWTERQLLIENEREVVGWRKHIWFGHLNQIKWPPPPHICNGFVTSTSSVTDKLSSESHCYKIVDSILARPGVDCRETSGRSWGNGGAGDWAVRVQQSKTFKKGRKLYCPTFVVKKRPKCCCALNMLRSSVRTIMYSLYDALFGPFHLGTGGAISGVPKIA